PAPSAPQPASAPAAEAPAAPQKPQIRMAPGHKAKPLPSVSAAQTGLTSAGFKPLQRARPVATISISVAAPPKQRPPKPAAEFVDDFERGNRKGKKDREGQKSFDKRTQKAGAAAAAAPAQPSSRISVDATKKEVSIRGAVVVKDFAAKLGIKPNRLIADLMGLKILASINQRIEPDVATKVAEKYGFKVTIEHARDKAAAKPVLKAIDADDLIPEDPPESLRPRAPVITFLGHVDHGKTTLMDWIRKEHVAQGEAGGITQQISAYQVEVAGKKITFLDTPGHAAFSAMRARGAQITDIAVLIIAADDGIMPQTEECIRVARQAGVQIMVAITKVDKPTSNVDRVKQQLQKAGLTPEDWGGDIICCPVSGVTGEGVDALLENILVQAEVLELQANPNRRANGYVIESELQQGLGPCATLLVSGGTLKVGDAILIGEHFGRVRALIDDHGRRIKEAPPATPVKCTGLSGVPDAGSEFRVMLDEKRARTLAAEAAQERKEQELAASKTMTLDALMSRMAAEGKRELNVIVKSDTQGSLEAIVQTLGEIKSEKVGLNVIGAGTGNVSLTDVTSAAAGKAVIVGFDIGTDAGVQQKARHDGVRINSFRIIYELVDHVKNCMLDLLPPEYKEVIKGHAEIKAIYDIGKLGKIAGSQMLNGSLVAKERFRILRNKAQIWDGKVQTLRHFKDEVKEVTGQQECGVCFANYEGFQVGDVIECYLLEELPRSL
ncbi:MAG: translation initiation factor IF-2, partial [Kiritimatiellae bacterium]|nr:translation initiation factor IF-2 [Kiritimatiellia bacterium]